MRWLAIATILVGAACDKGETQPPPVSPPPPARPAVAPPAPPDAAPRPPAIDAPAPLQPAPADLAAAPAWVGRSLYTGKIRATAVATRATLQHVDTRAMLTLEIRSAGTHLRDDAMEPWAPPETKRYLGTLVKDRLELATGAETISLACSTKAVSVARADAVRKRQGKGGCEGDVGRWVPGTTRTAKVLVCGDPTSEMDPSFTFVPPPGPEIEWVWVNDDCSMQGGGYRDIPSDGSIASPR